MPTPTLEQRMRRALQQAVPFPINIQSPGICFRNVKHEFANRHQILSALGSLNNGGRYNYIEAFGVLYLACDPHTCLEETTRATIAAGFVAARNLPRTFIGIRVRLARVLDLTDWRVRRRLGVSRALLLADWERVQEVEGREAPTQELGRLARAAGFEAVLTPSASWAGANLNIFPENLLPSSELSIVNETQLPTAPSPTASGV
jgi:RES domain-containing protein